MNKLLTRGIITIERDGGYETLDDGYVVKKYQTAEEAITGHSQYLEYKKLGGKREGYGAQYQMKDDE
jgi:hypothetical protein